MLATVLSPVPLRCIQCLCSSTQETRPSSPGMLRRERASRAHKHSPAHLCSGPHHPTICLRTSLTATCPTMESPSWSFFPGRNCTYAAMSPAIQLLVASDSCALAHDSTRFTSYATETPSFYTTERQLRVARSVRGCDASSLQGTRSKRRTRGFIKTSRDPVVLHVSHSYTRTHPTPNRHTHTRTDDDDTGSVSSA